MCGRFVITSPPEALRRIFGYLDQPNFPPRHNVAPTQPVPVVIIENGARHFRLMRWGLIPSWVKDPRQFTLLINARSETVLEKPAFKNAIRRRRCLIPADGFYEWKHDRKRQRTPFYVRRRDGEPFAFAGLWDVWRPRGGEPVASCTIITTEANELVAELHDRMPVILPPEAYDLWLAPAPLHADVLQPWLVPCPSEWLEAYPVSTLVNTADRDEPACNARVDSGRVG